MLNLFLGLPDGPPRRAMERALRAHGLHPAEVHADGAALLRAVGRRGGGVVLCGRRLTDMPAERLQALLGQEGLVAVLTSGEAPEGLRSIRLPMPAPAFAQCVRALLEEDAARRRALHRLRTPEEEAVIARAKQRLMQRRGLTEDAAHRLLQQHSMQQGIRLSAAAEQVLHQETSE